MQASSGTLAAYHALSRLFSFRRISQMSRITLEDSTHIVKLSLLKLGDGERFKDGCLNKIRNLLLDISDRDD